MRGGYGGRLVDRTRLVLPMQRGAAQIFVGGEGLNMARSSPPQPTTLPPGTHPGESHTVWPRSQLGRGAAGSVRVPHAPTKCRTGCDQQS
eukprot:SAG25_NODE_13430_length_267_cov_0.619048_1_plen_89_part_11